MVRATIGAFSFLAVLIAFVRRRDVVHHMYLYQLRGDFDRAARLYDRALRNDPGGAVVAANLGVFYVRQGMLPQALTLWRDTFDKNPQLTDLGLNLAERNCARP